MQKKYKINTLKEKFCSILIYSCKRNSLSNFKKRNLLFEIALYNNKSDRNKMQNKQNIQEICIIANTE